MTGDHQFASLLTHLTNICNTGITCFCGKPGGKVHTKSGPAKHNQTRRFFFHQRFKHPAVGFRVKVCQGHNATQQTTILLTSHYMADIQALCERVIIIDHGKISFDGKLSEVVDRFADFKLITIQCDGADGCSDESLKKYGDLVERIPGSIKLKVKRDRVIPVCKALLDELPVRDIDIEEVPIEDVIRQIFAR